MSKRAKPLAATRRKIVKAIKKVQKEGIEVGHTWGKLKDHMGLLDSEWFTLEQVRDAEAQTCPMGAVILVYDDVDNSLTYESAAAEILGTTYDNVDAFIEGYDAPLQEDAVEQDYQLSRLTETQRRWYRLGESLRGYAE